jgi:predicted permease
VGVLPADFAFLRSEAPVVFGNRFDAPDVYYPLEDLDPSSTRFGNFVFHAMGRLAPGATIAEAQGEIEDLMYEAAEAYPGLFTAAQLREGDYRPRVTGLKDALVGDVAQVLWILLSAVGFVLLIALANVSGLFLVRAEARADEIAIRRAIGASRSSVGLAFAAEGALLGLGGGLLGFALATVGTSAVLRLVPGDVPRLDDVGPDPSVLAFTLTLSILAASTLTLAPMLRAPSELRSGLVEGGRGGTPGRRRLRARNALVVSQIALALVLLAGSALLLRTFQNLGRVDPGFDASNTLTLRLPLSSSILAAAGYEEGPADARRGRFMMDVAERIARIPGVERVAFSADLPLDGDAWHDSVVEEGGWRPDIASEMKVLRVFVGPGYLTAIGGSILRGRDIEREDFAEQPRVAVVNESFAAQRWPGEDPIGRASHSTRPA